MKKIKSRSSKKQTQDHIDKVKAKALEMLEQHKFKSARDLSDAFADATGYGREYFIKMMRDNGWNEEIMTEIYGAKKKPVEQKQDKLMRLNPFAQGFSQNIANTKAGLGAL